MTSILSHFAQLGAPFALKALRCLDAETAHQTSLEALKAGFVPEFDPDYDKRLALSVAGLDFPNPLGLAAGYDKNASVADALCCMGFGLLEVGSVTPLPQSGNPRPRLFRLSNQQAIINRMGFNNEGLDAVLSRVKTWQVSRVKRGINLGANKDSSERANDYCLGYQAAAPYADFLTINISSPNTPGLRTLQDSSSLCHLLERLTEAKTRYSNEQTPPPLFLKLAPDMGLDDLDRIIADSLRFAVVDGLILTNTTVARPGLDGIKEAGEAGGLSGKPLFEPSTLMLREAAQRLEGRLPLIGVGGIMSGDDALKKIEAGASLIQVYSGLVYRGPALIREIITTLSRALDERHLTSLDQLVGSALAK